jgi:uncharacterized protein YdaU (DUF1376 family)
VSEQRFAAFLFYVEDWLSSTAIDLVSAAEERGYLRLLLHSWKNPRCGIPNDDRVLAHLSKLNKAWYRKSGAVLRAQFFEKDGYLYNERLLRERDNQIAIRQARSQAGKAGAESRWRRDGGAIAEPLANAQQRVWQTGWQNDASSSSISNLNHQSSSPSLDSSSSDKLRAIYHRRFKEELAEGVIWRITDAVSSQFPQVSNGEFLSEAKKHLRNRLQNPAGF